MATPPPDELQPLREAVDGLTYPSESDEPFDVFRWDANGSAHDQVVAHAGKGRKVNEVPVAAFFKQLADSDDAERLENLRGVLEKHLKQLQIFRVGEDVEVDIYLIGRAGSGVWAGLHTVSVET